MTFTTLTALGALALAPADTSNSPAVTTASAATLASFDLAQGDVQNLALTDSVGAGLQIEVVLDGESELLELTAHSLRSADFEVLVQGADGSLQVTEVAASTTVRGTVVGRPEAWVAGSLANGRLEAMVSLGDGRSFGIQPTLESTASVGSWAHVIYEADDIVAPEGLCATPDGPHQHDQLHTGGSSAAGSGIADFRVCEVACDADVEFYNKNGMSVDATVADIENILIGVEAIYGFEAEILYEIGTIIVRTAETDPYSSTNPGTLLQQFDSHWSSQQQSVQRDIAHLFTGKNLDGSVIGIARLNAICSQTNGYGLSQSKYTNSVVLRTRLTAHELGHNWSAGHCNGASDCGIMCQGGCGSPTMFGNQSTNSILQEKNSSGCLTLLTAAPTLTGTSGDSAVWMPEPIELHGTDLFTATSVTVDGVVTTDFAAVDDQTILLVPPLPTSLGDVQVSVTTPLGTSNEVTLSFAETDPPQLAAPGNPGSGQLASWGYGGEANAAALMVFGFANTTIPIEGIDLLFPDEIVVVAPLSSIGLGGLTIQLPTLPIFTLIYSQVVTISGNGVKASDIEASIIFI